MEYNLSYFINKFEAIPEENWTTHTCEDSEGRHCALGHCGATQADICFTEEARALTYVMPYVMSINDHGGEQPTPKQRVLAALYDLKASEAVKQAENIIAQPSEINQPC